MIKTKHSMAIRVENETLKNTLFDRLMDTLEEKIASTHLTYKYLADFDGKTMKPFWQGCLRANTPGDERILAWCLDGAKEIINEFLQKHKESSDAVSCKVVYFDYED